MYFFLLFRKLHPDLSKMFEFSLFFKKEKKKQRRILKQI